MKRLLIALMIVIATITPQAYGEDVIGSTHSDAAVNFTISEEPMFITAGVPLAANEEQQLLQSEKQAISDMAGGNNGETALLAALGLIFCLVLIAGAAA